MADQLIAEGIGTGRTGLVAVRLNRDGEFWNADSAAFETFDAGDIADYALAMTEIGTTGVYAVADPAASTPGSYRVIQKDGADLTQADLALRLLGNGSAGPVHRVLVNDDMRGTNDALLAANYVAPANSDITAIKAKTDNLPASPAAVGDIPTASQNATQVRTELTTELARIDATISSRSTFAGGAVASVTAPVTVGTNNDKTGYSLTQAFPANFAAMGINSSGHVERVMLVDTTTVNSDMRGTDGAVTSLTGIATATNVADARDAVILQGNTAWTTADVSGLSTFDPDVDEVIVGQDSIDDIREDLIKVGNVYKHTNQDSSATADVLIEDA